MKGNVPEVEVPVPQGTAVGLDMGIKRFFTLSDGSFKDPLDSFKRHETALQSGNRRDEP